MKNKGMYFGAMGLLWAGVILFVFSANAGGRGSSAGSGGRTSTSSRNTQVTAPQRSAPSTQVTEPQRNAPDIGQKKPRATEPLDKDGPNEPVEGNKDMPDVKKGYFMKKYLSTKGQPKAGSPPDDSKPGSKGIIIIDTKDPKATEPLDKPASVKASSSPDNNTPGSKGIIIIDTKDPKATEPLDKPGGGNTGQVDVIPPPDDSKPGQVKATEPLDKPVVPPPDDGKPGQTAGQTAQ